ncbi:transposase [Candidatus Magnetomoraceae bacterium gMMP-15]
MDIKSASHCKYNINYHLVWCSKYRHKILIDQIEVFLKQIIVQICSSYEYDLLNMEIMPDHIHLFVCAPPWISPTEIVKTIKSITALEIFKHFSELKSKKF